MIEDAESIDASDLSIVIPAYNEEVGLGVTLDGVLRAFRNAEVIVVDDSSSDLTAVAAGKRSGVMLLKHAFNRGQGAALKTGMRHATRPYVAWFDADNEHRIVDLRSCLQRIRRNDVVAVIGQRTNGAASLVRAVGKWIIRLVGRGLNVNAGSDLNCGLRVFRRDVILPYAALIPNRFSASLVTTLVLIERQYPISFEAVQTAPRIGRSTVRIRDGFDAILALLRAVLLFAPLRFFLPIGGGALVIGFVYSMMIALLYKRGLPVAGTLAMGAGLLAIVLGLIADQLSQLRLSQLPDLTPLAASDANAGSTNGGEASACDVQRAAT